MYRNYRVVSFLLAFLLATSAFAKKKPSLKRADKYFKNTEYSKAAEEYKRLERGIRTDNYIYLQLANTYERLGRIIESSKYYGKAIDKDPEVDAQIYYKYAKVLEQSGRYEVARDMMDDFAEKVPQDTKAKDFLKNPDAYYELTKLPELFMFQESGLNDRQYDDFGAMMNIGDTLYFASNRTKHENKMMRRVFEIRDKTERKPNYDIYQAVYKGVSEPIFGATRLIGTINKRFNDGRVAPTLDGQQLIFASESYRYRPYRKNKVVKKRDGLMNLFVAQKKGKKWRKVKKLPFTVAKYHYSSPSISPDGQYLYFASNMEGSYGELDIWRVALLEDNEYGEPENLGPLINSGTRNDYPFVDSKGELYFASDRWGGYGGLDIYSVKLDDKLAKPKNLGAPINTARDEYSFVFYPDKAIGFFSSNRIGRTDIYKAIPTCKVAVNFTVKNKHFNTPVVDAYLEFTDHRRKVAEEAVSKVEGNSQVFLSCDQVYQLRVAHPDYLDEKLKVVVSEQGKQNTIEVFLRPYEEVLIEEKRIVLEDINFGFNQKEITFESKFELDKLVRVMKRNPSMRIMIESHTDSKGKAKYNLQLSEERAKATAEYLSSQGIEASRLEFKGYGASQPKVDCAPCSVLEDAKNRRSEFIILEQ